MHGLRDVAADRVDQAHARVLQAPLDDTSELRVVLDAHVLEHADGHELVVMTRDVAVVVLDELDFVREPFAAARAHAHRRSAHAKY